MPAFARPIWSLLPLIGTLLFVGLAGWATTRYPGGSAPHPTTIGFDWLNNYWCDLLAERAANGQPNPASPVALTAMGVLCLSLLTLWLTVPRLFPARRAGGQVRWWVQYPGITAMLVAPFIASAYHDAAINLASMLIVPPLLFTMMGLYRTRLRRLFWTGMLCSALMMLNQFIYQTHWQLNALPIVQKITFAAVLVWIGGISWRVYRAGRTIKL